MRKLAVLALIAAATACGPTIVPAPVVTAPAHPEFIAPQVPPALAGTAAATSQDRGWRFLQAGDLKNAEHEFTLALRASPSFFPAEAGLGYLALARQDATTALARFDGALAEAPQSASALVGRGQALLGLDRQADALAAFEAALAVDPSLADVRRRVAVLKFRQLESDLARARQAAREGRLAEADRAYTSAIASSPDSPFLYRELAEVERQEDRPDEALAHLHRAVALDPNDGAAWVGIGQILEGRQAFDGAAEAYASAVAAEPTDANRERLRHARAAADLARLPPEYRAIEQDPEITRGELAALIGVRLGPLLPPQRDAVLITDVRGHWAAPWIMTVARAGVMEPFANHAFQPGAVVRRIDFAEVASRLLDRVASADPLLARSWRAARVTFSDLSPGHLAYPAASAAVASGVMTRGADEAFEPGRPVTGAEAAGAIDRVAALAGPAPGAVDGRVGR